EHSPLPFDDDAFNVVVFNEVFEHLRINPIFTLGEVRRVLKPGGRVLLATPNLRSANGLGNFLLRGRAMSCGGGLFYEYQKLCNLGHMGHVREYTTREVIEFLTAIGFRVEEITYRGVVAGIPNWIIINLVPALRPFVSYRAVKV